MIGYDLRASPERCPECGVANAFLQAEKEAQRLAEVLERMPVSEESEVASSMQIIVDP